MGIIKRLHGRRFFHAGEGQGPMGRGLQQPRQVGDGSARFGQLALVVLEAEQPYGGRGNAWLSSR